MHHRILALAAALLVCSPVIAEQKTLIVSIDGCRPDALQITSAPNVKALIAAGSVSYDARNTLQYGDSGPNYSSMLTGTWLKHGVTSNSSDANGFLGNHFDLWPHMFSYLEASDPSLFTAQFCGWGPINEGTWADHYADEVGARGDSGNAARIATLLATGDPDVIFWQIAVVDSTGHSSGFSPTSTLYLNAITTADSYYGTVLNALRGRPGYINGTEDWLILTVTDHGGYGTSHHLPAPGHELEIQKTFYVATGPGVAVGGDLGQPRVYDVAVTAMAHMGLDTAGLNLDGLVVPPEPTTRWRLDQDGNISAPTNWTAGVPNGIGHAANLTFVITEPRQVTVDVPTTLGSMRFDNANTFTVAGPGPLTLQALSGSATLYVNSGPGVANHVISAPLLLASPLLTDHMAGGLLTIQGPLDNSAGKTIRKVGAGPLTLSGPQTHGPGATLAVDGGTVNLNSDAGTSSLCNLTVNVDNAARAAFGSTQHLAALNLASGQSQLTPGGAKVLVTHGLDIDPAAARLDLTDNAMIVRYTGGTPGVPSPELQNVKRWLASGCAGRTWTGNGIVSSAAVADPISLGVGYAQNDMLFAPYDAFAGEPVDLSTILVKFTYLGDVNLDGCVDDNDVTFFNLFYDGGAVDTHYWNEGDIFGYDGRVDDNDVTILNLTYGLGVGDPLGGAVPEPATLALLALGGLALLGRRRR